MQAAFLNKLVESDATQLLVCYELLQLGDIRVQPRDGRQEVCRVEISAETLELVDDLVHVLEVVDRQLRVGLLARNDLLIDAMASPLLRRSPVLPHNMQQPVDIDILWIQVRHVLSIQVNVLLNLFPLVSEFRLLLR